MIPIILFQSPSGAAFPVRSIAASPFTVTAHSFPPALRLYCPRGSPRKRHSLALLLASCSSPCHSSMPAGAPVTRRSKPSRMGSLLPSQVKLDEIFKMLSTVGAISVSDQRPPRFSSSTPGPRKTRGTRRASGFAAYFSVECPPLPVAEGKTVALVGGDCQPVLRRIWVLRDRVGINRYSTIFMRRRLVGLVCLQVRRRLTQYFKYHPVLPT